jgi:hypothetical protein
VRETITDYGVYRRSPMVSGKVGLLRSAAITCSLKRRVLHESIIGPDPDRASRWRISPNLTWYPSEFSKIPANTITTIEMASEDHSLWVQFNSFWALMRRTSSKLNSE